MKTKDIKNYEIIEGCFGKTLKINGIDLRDIPKEKIKSFIIDMMNDDNDNLIDDILELSLSYLHFDLTDSDGFSTCEQCGSWNRRDFYSK